MRSDQVYSSSPIRLQKRAESVYRGEMDPQGESCPLASKHSSNEMVWQVLYSFLFRWTYSSWRQCMEYFSLQFLHNMKAQLARYYSCVTWIDFERKKLKGHWIFVNYVTKLASLRKDLAVFTNLLLLPVQKASTGNCLPTKTFIFKAIIEVHECVHLPHHYMTMSCIPAVQIVKYS